MLDKKNWIKIYMNHKGNALKYSFFNSCISQTSCYLVLILLLFINIYLCTIFWLTIKNLKSESKTWNLKTRNLTTGHIKPDIWNPKPKAWKVNLNSEPGNKTWYPNMKYKTWHFSRKSKPEIKNLKYKAWKLNPEIKTRNKILKTWNLKSEI